ncbi:hypothetical protein [Pseudomonas congelans]|uniref:hypothetical protein n=1 Tax=Pseudomonas congelans TaxID=200452 RepID=UPI001C334590|nr:hypothetical protein [Pseudomonas congelans]QVX08388.1 hypothetical protein DBV21_13740 [Pseudomonas congelans]
MDRLLLVGDRLKTLNTLDPEYCTARAGKHFPLKAVGCTQPRLTGGILQSKMFDRCCWPNIGALTAHPAQAQVFQGS